MKYPNTDWQAVPPESQGIEPEHLKRAVRYLHESMGAAEAVLIRNGVLVWEGAESPDLPWGDPNYYIRPVAPLFEAGTRLKYHDPNVYLLGYILSKLTGRTLEDLARTRIAVPIGMKRFEWRALPGRHGRSGPSRGPRAAPAGEQREGRANRLNRFNRMIRFSRSSRAGFCQTPQRRSSPQAVTRRAAGD